MTRSLALFATRTGGPPFLGSVGYVNDAIAPALTARGWSVNAFQPPRVDGDYQEALLPLALANRYLQHAQAGRADVALYDCAGTTLRAPSKAWADRHVVLYHGLVYGTGNWLCNEDIDLHCGNSPYSAQVLRALFAMPDWRGRCVLNAHAFDRVTDVRLPVPSVEAPDGHPGFAHGVDAPADVLRLADGKAILGHALQPGKQDMVAALSILYWLNRFARERGQPRVLLLISDASLPPERRRALDALLAGSGFSCADFFVPVPHLHQRAVVQVMRACTFGLAYNRFPEPFGFYVLESVYQGCPVYTNGVGNNRHLLPAAHGIEVHESPGMLQAPDTAPDLGAYRVVAERILQDAIAGNRAADCARGRDHIARTWTLQAFGDDLAAAIERARTPTATTSAFDALRVGWSPLLRSLDLERGHCFNDYGGMRLSPEACAEVRALLGAPCSDLDADRMHGLEVKHGLFARGILSLHAADAPPATFDTTTATGTA